MWLERITKGASARPLGRPAFSSSSIPILLFPSFSASYHPVYSPWQLQSEQYSVPSETKTSPAYTALPELMRTREAPRVRFCSAEVKARWKADAYRYAPYQYRVQNMVHGGEASLRPLTGAERCVRLGFPWDRCLPAVHKAGLSAAKSKDVILFSTTSGVAGRMATFWRLVQE